MLEVSVLASGSSGNCFYIGTNKGDILVDCGISTKQIVDRLNNIGKSIDNIKGVFVTHEHYDHVKGIDVISKRFNIPIFLNSKTLEASSADMGNINVIKTDEEFDFNGLKILPFAKSHDANDPVSYLIKNGSKKVSIITDIGYCCHNVIDAVKSSDVIILESNHDQFMLKNGPYPAYLKKRIQSKEGHISNYEAGLLVLEHGGKRLQHVLLSHMSENNNTPEIALKTFNSLICERRDLKNLKTWLTYREKPTDVIKVR